MIDLERIKKLIVRGKSAEEVFGEFDWKGFEDVVSEIFVANNFHVKRNFRFKTKNRFEIDVVATNSFNVFCVDCKEWSLGRSKNAALKIACEKQEMRLKEFKKFLKKNLIAQKLLKLSEEKNFLPILVTLHQEDIIKHNETFVIPIKKLNYFLNNF